MKFLVFVAILLIAACTDSGSRGTESTHVRSIWNECCTDALRVRLDASRNRLWVLGIDRVDVYDLAGKQLIRRIALPDWYVAELICEPDMVLDRSGTAFISNNLQPRLWQVDSEDFQLKEHVIRLANRERWDVGFGSLAFTADGTLFGVTSSGGSLWSIDIDNAMAHQVALNAFVPDACPSIALVAAGDGRPDRAFALCAGVGSISRRIDVASDRARGQVVDEPCDGAAAGKMSRPMRKARHIRRPKRVLSTPPGPYRSN